MTRRTTSDEGLAALKRWEGLVLYAYDDADPRTPKRFVKDGDPVKGTLTIGYGHTRTVKPGDQISEERAAWLFRQDLQQFEDAVSRIVQVPLTDGQFAALVSFTYNLGEGALAKIAETLNKGDYAGALARMQLYNKQRLGGNLVTVPGLVNRRAAEAGLWVRGDFVTSASVPAAAAPEPKPAVEAATLGTVAAAVATAAPALTSLGGLPVVVGAILVGGAIALAAILLLRKRS
jgi:lysozyme